jgi:predicted ATPase/class 3 adenylate cyclase
MKRGGKFGEAEYLFLRASSLRRNALPDSVSVTVTFLFTDIEGSSRMWELDPAAMDVALHLHNQVVSQTVRAHRGKIFKSMGDAFCCVFEDAADATRAAIAAQIELGRQTWPASTGALRARMGLHTGAATHDKNDYFGTALNRVARIMSSAHGGQIVVATATVAVLGVPPDGVAFRDLGVKRLKDLEQPERLYQVVAEGLSTQFPPLRTLDEHPNNLPTQLSSFVGRRAELDRVANAFTTSRVVTIAGPGGIGKTRLALQFASEATERFPGGVFFVELANITDRVLVPHSLAAAFGLAENSAEQLVETIARFVGDKFLLLILDNSEHLLTEVAAVTKALASSCPNLSVLATSREPLHLTGERVERLTQMSLPERVDASELETSDGCRLFLERARAAGSVGIDAVRDAEAIIAICRRLEGFPLAIELAASRAQTMPLRALADKIDVHFLVNKDTTADYRHRTLSGAIDWSYRLLDESERDTFVALSVFRGCSNAALATVMQREVYKTLESLVDKSLVQVSLTKLGDTRYYLLEPIREFATAVRSVKFDKRRRLEERHFDLFRSLVASCGAATGLERRRLYLSIADDVDNVRVVLDWSVTNRPIVAAEMLLELNAFWRARGSFTEGRQWMDRILAGLPTNASLLRANILRQAAAFAVMQDDYPRASLLADSALAQHRELKNDAGIGATLHTLAEIAHRKGYLSAAERLYKEAYRYLRASNHVLGQSTCLMNRGLIARQRGSYSQANTLLRKAERLAGGIGDSIACAQIQIELAWVLLYTGDTARGMALFEQAMDGKISEDDRHGACQGRLGLATAQLLLGNAGVAEGNYISALMSAVELNVRRFIGDAMFGLAATAAIRGELPLAARYYGFASVSCYVTDEKHLPSKAGDLADAILHERMDGDQRRLEHERGSSLSLGQILIAIGAGTTST